MSQDDVTSEEEVELTEGSEETLDNGEEDNSLGEAKKKNPSHFKKLAKKAKALENNWRNPDALRARLAELQEEEEEEDDDIDEPAPTSLETRLFFIENPEAKNYREEMEELVDENPRRKSLPLSDLLDLAKIRFPKSTTKKTIDISGGRASSSDVSKMDFSKMTPEEIESLPLDVYRELRKKK